MRNDEIILGYARTVAHMQRGGTLRQVPLSSLHAAIAGAELDEQERYAAVAAYPNAAALVQAATEMPPEERLARVRVVAEEEQADEQIEPLDAAVMLVNASGMLAALRAELARRGGAN